MQKVETADIEEGKGVMEKIVIAMEKVEVMK